MGSPAGQTPSSTGWKSHVNDLSTQIEHLPCRTWMALWMGVVVAAEIALAAFSAHWIAYVGLLAILTLAHRRGQTPGSAIPLSNITPSIEPTPAINSHAEPTLSKTTRPWHIHGQTQTSTNPSVVCHAHANGDDMDHGHPHTSGVLAMGRLTQQTDQSPE